MNPKVRQFLILLAQSLIFWVIAIILFSLFRYYGIGEEEGLPIDEKFEIPITQWLDLAVILGGLIGVFYAIIEQFFQTYISKRVTLGLSVLLKTLVYLVVLILTITLVSFLAEKRMDVDLNNDLGWWRTDKTFWMLVLYFVLASLVFSFIKIANEKFGKGVFLKMLLGRYRKPKEEKHVFMFLDLKASTTIAEKLGHINYSAFIQDCFFDLNSIVERYSANIYQYVGDEAVLNWSYNKAIQDTRCIDLFFAFKKRLLKRQDYYLRKYQWFPEFKAGLHGGLLTVTEIGTVKKELAFHGDVINTTARIQNECNAYGVEFLISEVLLKNIVGAYRFTSKSIGNIGLKGKEEQLSLYAIRLNEKM